MYGWHVLQYNGVYAAIFLQVPQQTAKFLSLLVDKLISGYSVTRRAEDYYQNKEGIDM